MTRRYAQGAEVGPRGTSFRVWAPARKKVELVASGPHASTRALQSEPGGYFSIEAPLPVGTLYRYRLDGGDLFPDPASRFQPEGPHGPSQIVDPRSFAWTDRAWRCDALHRNVIYEMHVGTFTREGTWASATEALDYLVGLGVTLLEIMPIAEFPGRFGWGYDGVNWYAPAHIYGAPDDVRRFVDRAHALGLGVIVDVVYNHVGPNGNYLAQYSSSYFTKEHATDWGDPINYAYDESHGVRSLVVDNASYWIDEFHFDGLRLDATQNIYDSTTPHVLEEIARAARKAGGDRRVLLVAENESQEAKLVRAPDAGGYGLDGLWNDDFHHAAVVALTGHREAYYTDYEGTPQELLSALKYGYLYQGQRYPWQEKRRGTTALDIAPSAFITYLENHDQVANSATGARLHEKTSAARLRAMTALLLLGPGTPMLFQGQDQWASAPFLFFAEHDEDLNAKIRAGRAEFLQQFPSLASTEAQAGLDDPSAIETFRRCKIDQAERSSHAAIVSMHKSLAMLRKSDPRILSCDRFDGAVLSAEAFCARWMSRSHGDLLGLLNLGHDLEIAHPSEPLLAPLEGSRWTIVWSSEENVWGGGGMVPPEDAAGNWRLQAESFTLLGSLPGGGSS